MAVALSPSDFALLCRVIDAVARAGHLPAVEAEEFSQWVHLHLLERNYAPLTQFAGRSSLRTFVTVVVRRLLLDWRNLRLGKWRPSAWARRHGPFAVHLDRLLTRDCHSVDEAIAILRVRPGCPGPEALRELASNMPWRRKPHQVSYETIDSVASLTFDDPVQSEQDARARRHLLRSLRRARRQLSPLDRRVLHLKFDKNLAVPAIAARLGVAAKPLYRRIEKVVAQLRRSLEVSPGGIPARRALPGQ